MRFRDALFLPTGFPCLHMHLGAGKHPSPLDISESYSPEFYLKVGFYLIKKYCSCPKLSQFKDRALL